MSLTVVVRLFAAARDAAGTPETAVTLPITGEHGADSAGGAGGVGRATLRDVLTLLVDRHGGPTGRFAAVLPQCSYLLDGQQARSETFVSDGATLDVLPPFAGG